MQVKKLDQHIDTKQEERDAINDTLIKASRITDEPIIQSNNTSPVESTVEKIFKYNDYLNKEIDRLADLKITISQQINELNDDRYRTILIKYYLRDSTWEQIAVDMNYDYRHVTRLHGEALKEFENMHHHVLKCPNNSW